MYPNTSAASQDPASPTSIRLADLAGDLLADHEARQQARKSGTPLGPLSGFAELDETLSGCFMPGLHTLSGSPGVGKTALALSIASQCQCPAVFVSCEITPLEVLRRMVSRHTGLFLGRMKNGDPRLSTTELSEKIQATAAASPLLIIVDGTSTAPTPAELCTIAHTARTDPLAGGTPHFLMVIDSVSVWADNQSTFGTVEYDRLNTGIAMLRTIAMEGGYPILGVAEQSKESSKASTKGQGDSLHASAGTRKFEYSSETMIAMQKADESPVTDANGLEWQTVYLNVAKNRHGPTKRLTMRWNGATQAHEEAGF